MADCERFLAALAAPTPGPGGGSAAALAGAMAAALVEMACGVSLRRSRGAGREDEEVAGELMLVRRAAEAVRHRLSRWVDGDREAFERVIGARRLRRVGGGASALAVETASKSAALASLEIVTEALAVLDLAGRASVHVIRAARPDLVAAARLACAAVEISADNALANIGDLGDHAFVDDVTARAEEARRRAGELWRSLISV